MSAKNLQRTLTIESALNEVKATAATVSEHVVQALTTQSASARRIAERDLLFSASLDMQHKSGLFQSTFNDALDAQVAKELSPEPQPFRPSVHGVSEWQTLTLVEDQQVDEEVFGHRLGQEIGHACEVELRDLAPYMSAVLGHEQADEGRNPLRPDNLGRALYQAISAVSSDAELRKILGRELGRAMAQAMKEGYKHIREDLLGRGLQPLGFAVKGANEPTSQFGAHSSSGAAFSAAASTGRHSSHDSLHGDATSGYGQGQSGQRSGRGSGLSTRSGVSTGFGSRGMGGESRGAGRDGRAGAGGAGGSISLPAYSHGGEAGSGVQASDAQLMSLLRRLSVLPSTPPPLEGRTQRGAASVTRHSADTEPGALYSDDLAGLMAVNLIRTHREELIAASTGKLDPMVIDIVASLFDQILSDPKVPPQMARQISRLQMPVLRVALSDNTFFSSRKHPVRRFVDRTASLACAFDHFEDGPGQRLLARISELVQDIVDGDFDQADLYGRKLAELEAFVAEQSQTQEPEQAPNPALLLVSKESELRVQQHYMQQLKSALTPIDIPVYLRDFISQVWSQALVLAYRQAGPEGDLTKAMRCVGRDLVLSVQPKGSTALSQKFLKSLPALMKDLKRGMTYIGWPEAAQEAFFADLLPAHAESLKQPPLSELDHNLLSSKLEEIFSAPIPTLDTLGSSAPWPVLESQDLEIRFSTEEALKVGLVNESAVDWSGKIDIDLGDESLGVEQEPGPGQALMITPDAENPDVEHINLDLGGDLSLELNASEPATPSRGADLANHLQMGFAYQMFLHNKWQKVRLHFVSPGRTFFVFTHGERHTETTSFTARVLARMCGSGRLRAVETAFLIERATARARKQLSELMASKRH